MNNTFFEGKVEFNNSLYFSIVETSLAPNLSLVAEDVEVFCNNCTGEPFSEGLTAVPHCNGIDYWLIVHGSFELVVYLVNANGVSQSGIFTSDAIDAISTLKSSPDGTMLALGTLGNSNLGTGRLILYDFNSTTGVISNEDVLSTEQHYGVSFSPNSQILYAINSDYSITHPNQFGLEVYDLTNTLTNYVLPISSYSHAMQLANNGIIYINKNDGNLGAITTPDNFVNPNPTETTDGIVLSQQQAITQFIDAIQPPIPTDFIANVGTCGTVDVDINPCWTGYNVTWDFGDGGTSTTASTSYQYTSAGIFTITLTVSLGTVSQTFSQEVTVNTCCTSPLGSSTVPVTGANSSAYPFGLIGSTIAINGNFTINNTNFAISNKTLLMAPNTKIIVLPGAKLTINKSKLYSCGTDMWDGIEIRPGGELIISNKTFIEDAKIAVLSDNFGGIAKFDISNTLFNRNHTGIKVQKYQTGTPHPGLITGCTFDSRPSVTSTTNTRLLDAPFQNQTAEIGIELSSINSFLVGNTSTPATKNYFKYLRKGIYGINAVYTVYNNEFSDNAPKGWAIYNLKSSKTFVGGSGTNQPNTFKNLYNGISHRSSSDLLVEYNTFTNVNLPNTILTGNNAISVYTNECNSATITLQKNQLNTVATGFEHFKNEKATYKAIDNVFSTFTNQAISCIENRHGNIDIRTNNFTGGANPLYLSNTAVYVAGTGNTFLTSSVVTISDNTISRINKGVHVINIGRPEIYRNSITFAANISPLINEWYKGIQTQNCTREEIHQNTIDKTGANPSAVFVKGHGLQKLKIRRYTKLVSNLVDCSLVLNSFSLKKPKNMFL